MDYKDILYNYAEYFEQSDVASNVIRWIGWEIIKLLHGICDLCQGLWEAVFQALDFTQVFATKVGEFYPIWYAVFVVTILAAGTIFLFSEHRPPLIKNLIITMAVVMLLPGGVRLSAQLLQIEQTALWQMEIALPIQRLLVMLRICCIRKTMTGVLSHQIVSQVRRSNT